MPFLRTRRLKSILSIVVATNGAVFSAGAQVVEGKLPPVEWSPSYRRVGWLDYALTALGATAMITSRQIGPPDGGPHGGWWFDEGARDAIRGRSFRGRFLAANASDVLLSVTASYGFVGDPLINAAWLRESPDVGKQLFWINSEVMALTLGLQQTTANIVGRERPFGRTCSTDELDEKTHLCEERDRYRSFFSGHTSVPFSIAAATCVNHIYLPLSGGDAWVPCTLGFLAASASGTLRIVADKHYATDVMTGAVVGTTIGFAIPLIHYTTGFRPPSAKLFGSQIYALPMVEAGGPRPAAGVTFVGMLP